MQRLSSSRGPCSRTRSLSALPVCCCGCGYGCGSCLLWMLSAVCVMWKARFKLCERRVNESLTSTPRRRRRRHRDALYWAKGGHIELVVWLARGREREKEREFCRGCIWHAMHFSANSKACSALLGRASGRERSERERERVAYVTRMQHTKWCQAEFNYAHLIQASPSLSPHAAVDLTQWRK